MPMKQSSHLLLADLRELVRALDRRVPHLERATEADIARDAEELRARAIALIELLQQHAS